MKKTTLLLLFSFLLTFTTQAQWQQLGQDIDGEAAFDGSGRSVSLSADGSIMAIGAPGNENPNGTTAGHVRVFQNNSGTWAQVGQDIDGEAAGDFSGGAVSLSADGTIVAIGADSNDDNGTSAGHVRVYQNTSGTWTQIGQDIDGEAANDSSGFSVSLSADGTIVAIGAIFNDGVNGGSSGHVRIYAYNGIDTWIQQGQDIDGEAASDRSGQSVALSADGAIVAIGANFNAGVNGTFSGHVRIYQNNSGTWTQIGQDIDGEAASDVSGESVALSADGSIVAIGAIGNDDNGTSAGHVRVYQNNSGTWTQVGQDIDGETTMDLSGAAVSLSADGTIVAIGATSNDGNGSNAGHVRIYQNNSGTWTQVGDDIDGEAAGDDSGEALTLSADGSIVAVGAYRNNGVNGADYGHVRVYEYIAPSPCIAATRLYVNTNATGLNNGTSWADAFTDLQPALDCADAGEEIWVAEGTYTPTESPDGAPTGTGNERFRAFHLANKDLKIYGGFNGTETLLSERDFKANATILSGDFNNDDVVTGTGATLTFTNNTENAYHVLINLNLTAAAILDGFSILGGNADGFVSYSYAGINFSSSIGGGIYNRFSSPTLSNLVVTENHANNFGGGLYQNGDSSITNSTFSKNNTNFFGGGIENTGSITLTNVTISGNNANVNGGGFFNEFSTSATLTNVTFALNNASAGGGLHNKNSTTTILKNTVFFDNTAANHKDIFNDGGATTISFSAVEDYTGTCTDCITLTASPFTDATNPGGADNIFATADDGLVLIPGSPPVGAGTATGAPTTDITGATRPNPPSMGAYEEAPALANILVNVGTGDLEFIDTADRDDDLTIVINGANYRLSDPTNPLTAGAGAAQIDANTVDVPIASVTGDITINTMGGDDSFTTDFSGGNFTDSINYDGGTQNASNPGDILILEGGVTFASVEHTFVNDSDGSVAVAGNPLISYVGLEPVIDNLSVTDRVFTFTGAAETITLSDDLDAADNESFIDSTLGESVTFTNPTNSVTINTEVSGGSGADILNIQGLDANFDADLTVNAGADDGANFITSPTSIGTGSYDINGRTITASQNITTTGAGSITFNAFLSILVGPHNITAQNGTITLNANATNTLTNGNQTAIRLLNTAIRTTGSGNINLTGIATSNGLTDIIIGVFLEGAVQIEALGSGAINITGVGGNGTSDNYGIRVGAGTIKTSGSGIQLNGTGGNGSDSGNYGIEILPNAVIEDLAGGDIIVNGIGGSGTVFNVGILNGGNLTTTTGAITVTGEGSSIATGTGNYGIFLFGNTGTGTIETQDGVITLEGTSGTGTEDNDGIKMQGGAVVQATGTGIIMLDGTSTGGTVNNNGVFIDGTGTTINAAGGNIDITGQGALGASGNDNYGIKITDDADIENTTAGTITLTGTGGSGSFGNTGININSQSSITSQNGAITISGTGGTGTGGFHTGVVAANQPIIESTGVGAISITGMGGSGTAFNQGIDINSNVYMSSMGGDIMLQGTGGTGTGSGQNGIFIGVDTNFTTTGTGNITMNGTGGSGIDQNHGLVIRSDSNINSLATVFSLVDGTIALNGVATDASDGVRIASPVTSTGTEIVSINGTTTDATANAINITSDIDPGSISTGGTITVTATTGKIKTLGGIPANTQFTATTATFNGVLSPGQSPGLLNVAGNVNIGIGDTIEIEINGTTPGTDYDQLAVTGMVDITDATLTLVDGLAADAAINTTFTIIDNDGTDAILGNFNGLVEGAIIPFNGQSLSISYVGGDGNDAVLTVVPATLSIVATTQAAEDATDGLFTISTSNQFSTPVTVNLMITGTATEGTDYATIGASVVFPANQDTLTIPLDVTADAFIEGDETVIVTMTGTDNANASIGTPDNATVTITDDDAATLSIAATTQAAEDATNGIFTITASQQFPTDTNVTFTVLGTATAGTDYTDLGTSFVFPANTNSVTITVPVIADTIDEADETVIVTLTGTDNLDVTIGTPDSATVTISDNDETPIVVQGQLFTIDENLPNTTAIGNIIATDTDPGTTFQNWTILSGNTSIDGDMDGPFAIDPATGLLTVNDSGDLDFESGTTSFTLSITVSDGTNTSAPETVIININDVNECDPLVPVTNPITVALIGTSYTLTQADRDAITSGSTGTALSFSFSQETFTCADIPSVAITVTFTDDCGTSTNEMVAITIEDSMAPVVNCVAPFAIQLDVNGMASITAADVDGGSTDNCGIATIVIDVTDFTCADIGPNTVTLTVTDTNGLMSTCTTTVTVEDTLPPVAMCVAPFTLQLDALGMASITAADIDNGSTDNCGIATIAIDTSDFTCADIGPNTVTLAVTDTNGLMSTCTTTVTVEDTLPPMITCPSDQTESVDTNCEFVLPDYTALAMATDNCAAVITITQDPVAGTIVSQGIIVVTIFADDGTTTNSCTFNVDVQDTIPPTIACPGDMTENVDATCAFVIPDYTGLATALDNCANPVSVFQLPAPGTIASTGITLITLSAFDGTNTTDCTFNLTVVDTIPPVVTCPADQAESANTDCEFVLPDYTGLATTSDNCGVTSITQTPPAGTVVAIGVTIVEFLVSDGTNTASCQFNVTVSDTTAPIITCLGDQSEIVDANCEFIIPDYIPMIIATDNCGTATVTQSPVAGTIVSAGLTTITITATDGVNSDSCTFDINVVDDVVPMAVCQDINLVLDATGMATLTAAAIDGGSSDNCGNVTLSIDITTFNCDTLGENDVTLIVTDDAGNESSCVAVVTVIDETAPTAICQDLTIFLDEDGQASITVDDVNNGSSDACGVSEVSIDITNFDCSNFGDNIVTLTVTDINGNESTCEATVTVMQNNATPVAMCQNITVVLNQDGMAFITPSNVDGGSLGEGCTNGLVIDIDTFTCDDAGLNEVTLTVTNGNGESASCVAIVNVVDNLSPVIICPEDTVIIAALAPFELPDFVVDGTVTVQDNCLETLVITQDPPAGTLVEEGETDITIIVTDPSGNEVSCEFTIFVDPSLNATNYEEQLKTLRLYPNPATSFIILENPNSLDLKEAQLIDVSGRIVKRFNLSQTSPERILDISEIASASYFLLVEGTEGSVSFQVIKR